MIKPLWFRFRKMACIHEWTISQLGSPISGSLYCRKCFKVAQDLREGKI